MMDDQMDRYFFAAFNRELLNGATPEVALQRAATDYARVLLGGDSKVVRVAEESAAPLQEEPE
jgi:hypothetical protein